MDDDSSMPPPPPPRPNFSREFALRLPESAEMATISSEAELRAEIASASATAEMTDSGPTASFGLGLGLREGAMLPPPPPQPPLLETSSQRSSSSDRSSTTSNLPPLSIISTMTGTTQSPFSSPPSSAREGSFAFPAPAPVEHWPSLNPFTAYYTPGHLEENNGSELPLRMDIDSASVSASASPAPGSSASSSTERNYDGRSTSVSLDDPDVRLAAEALGDLRADFVSPPQNPPSEPLLSLLTASYPLVARTIEGTTSAYNTSKNFSPRIKSGVEYVEGYLTPIGNKLGSVGRATGVEGGMRWILRASRRQSNNKFSSPSLSSSSSTHKRRREDRGRGGTPPGGAAGWPPAKMSKSGTPEPGGPLASSSSSSVGGKTGSVDGDAFSYSAEERRLSMSTVETLPAYDDAKSPAYTEPELGGGGSGSGSGGRSTNNAMAAWPSRFILSTSGLSIAMSEESLRSLKYCLDWLRWANVHIGKSITDLKQALDKYDSAQGGRGLGGDAAETVAVTATKNTREEGGNGEQDDGSTDDGAAAAAAAADRHKLAAQIAILRGDVLKTLRGVIETVSKYTGGALPENARVLVHRHLTSLPQRFRLANLAQVSDGGMGTTTTNTAASDSDIKEGAQRVLVLAREGLEMMAQVSCVLDGTIVSAEEWCERLGKKKKRRESGGGSQSGETISSSAGTPGGSSDFPMMSPAMSPETPTGPTGPFEAAAVLDAM